jgi:hypothetical protein
MPATTTSGVPDRMVDEEASAMNADREQPDEDATSVEKPAGPPPDEGKAYDPAMTDTDEANIPPESDSDPEARP